MGYTVTRDCDVMLTSGREVIADEKLFNAIKKGWLVCRNGKRVRLSLEEMNNLQNEIADFVDFKLRRLLKEQENRS